MANPSLKPKLGNGRSPGSESQIHQHWHLTQEGKPEMEAVVEIETDAKTAFNMHQLFIRDGFTVRVVEQEEADAIAERIDDAE